MFCAHCKNCGSFSDDEKGLLFMPKKIKDPERLRQLKKP